MSVCVTKKTPKILYLKNNTHTHNNAHCSPVGKLKNLKNILHVVLFSHSVSAAVLRSEQCERKRHKRHYLHVPSLCSFHRSVHQTLSASHGVEEELCGRQTRIEAVGHKAFSSGQLLRNHH